MSYRVGINGFGRIGRSFVRCAVERGLLDQGFVKVFGWYDIEWGYTNGLVDLTLQLPERS